MKILNHPVLCNYYLTYRCNAKCGFCDLWEKPSPYANIDSVKLNLEALKRLGVNVIDFTGGEPLLHRELPEFLQLAKDLGFITTVTTNCLLYPKLAEKLKGKVDMLHFSLDSIDSDRHNRSRGVECYDHFSRSIEIALDLGEKPDIIFTVTDENVGEIEAVYDEFALNKGLILILNPMFEYQGYGNNMSQSGIEKLADWEGKPNVYLNKAFLELRKSGGNKTNDPVCKAGESTIVISPENKLILPCYHLNTREVEINGDLEKAYYSEESEEIKGLAGKLEACEGCTINCYMEPSFAQHFNKHFAQSLGSTLKYALEKWVFA